MGKHRVSRSGPTRTVVIAAVAAVWVVGLGAVGAGVVAAQGTPLTAPVPPPTVSAGESVDWPGAADAGPEAVAPAAGPTVIAKIPKPPKPVYFSIESTTPEKGKTYGVGIPVIVNFDMAIPKKARAGVQQAAVVTSTNPTGQAMWTWIDSDTMAYRPKHFWPEKSDITVRLAFQGVQVGMATKKRPLVGLDDQVIRFEIGRNQVTRINLATQTGKVFRDGKVVRTVYVSTGKPGFKTRSGVKVIHEKVYNKVFTGDAFNEDYRLVSKYALRLTPTGEFLHSATWAYGRLGRYAGSHGCTNMTDSDAYWFMQTAQYGDPVIYFGDPYAPEMTVYNGLGGPWNVSWKDWKKNTGKTKPVTAPLPAAPQ